MNLPDILIRDEGGFIHLTSHRIGLHHVLRLYLEGASPEMVAVQYPTLGLSLIHRIIAFYLDNQAEVDQYMGAHEQEMQRQRAAARPVPSMDQLRQRLGQIRGAAVAAE